MGILDGKEEAIKEFCAKWHVRRLELFGSQSTGAAREDSDVDFLVEFEEGHQLGYDMIKFEDELSELTGRKADVVNPKYLHRLIKPEVVREAVTIYESS